MPSAAQGHLRRLRVAVALSVCLLALVGCRGDSSTAPLAEIASGPQVAAENGVDQNGPDEALAAVLSAMEAHGSYRVTGTTVGGGAIDISFKVGAGATGTVDSGSPVTLVALDNRVYVTGDAEFMAENVGADAAERMAGKWLLLPQDATSGFSIFADGGSFADAVLGAQGPVEMAGVRDVNGAPALGLVFPESGGTLWVSAQGDPLPIQFEEKGASAGTGVLAFTDFGADVAIQAPAAGSVVDVESLPGQ
ncbi:MAG: hypothetical protein ACRDWI_10955 [Jiangellaceae bacterium]